MISGMMEMWKILLGFFVGLFKSKVRLEAENAYLRHQLNVLRRKVPHRIVMGNWDRMAFVWFYRRFPFLIDATRIVAPATVIRWHRQGFKAYWRRKSRNPGGRPRINKDLRDLIHQMCGQSLVGSATDTWRASQARD